METPRRRALGKGLEELFNTEVLDFDSIEEQIVTETPKEEVLEVVLNELRSNPYQPRKVFDEKSLQELADSIREHGVFQPIIVKKSIKGYEIVAGERRVKASLLVGLKTIPAIVRNFSDAQMMEIALLENLQREDLTAVEEALAYTKLMETLNLTQEQLAKRVGKSRAYVTNMIGILLLPTEVKDMINEGKISMSHAKMISKYEDPLKAIEIANRIIDENLSVREVEAISQDKSIAKRNKIVRKEISLNAECRYVQEELQDKLGTKVKIGTNKIEIYFANIEDLNRIAEVLNIGK